MPPSNIGTSAFKKLSNLPELFDHISLHGGNVSESVMDHVNEFFNNISSHWQQGNYQEILKEADSAPLYCLCDIRICVYYLYSSWVAKANRSLSDLISILANILKHEQQPGLLSQGEASVKNAKILKNSIGLFFRKLITSLEAADYYQKNSKEDLKSVIHSLGQLKDVVDAGAMDIGEENYDSLRQLGNYFIAENKENKDDILSSPNDFNAEIGKNNHQSYFLKDGFSNSSKIYHESEMKSAGINIYNLKNTSFIDPALFNPSCSLNLLFRKISALKTLIEKRQVFKSSIVLADIQHELDNFNPLNYLPEYFADFAGLRAKHAAALEPYFSQQKTYQWRVLSEYYHSDMAAFVDLEGDDYPINETQNYGGSYTEGEFDD